MDLLSLKVAYASEGVDKFISNVDTLIINPLIKLLFALAVVYFLWGMFQFLSNQENEEKKTSGKSHMLWGIIGMTIMMGVWFLLGLIVSTLGIKGINPQASPGKGQVDSNQF